MENIDNHSPWKVSVSPWYFLTLFDSFYHTIIDRWFSGFSRGNASALWVWLDKTIRFSIRFSYFQVWAEKRTEVQFH